MASGSSFQIWFFFPLSSLRKGLEMYHWFSWNLLCRPGQLKLIKIWLALPPEFWKWRLPCWTQTWFCHSVLLYRPGCPWIQSSCISLPDGFVCYNTPGSLMFHVDKNKTNKKPDRITTLFMKMQRHSKPQGNCFLFIRRTSTVECYTLKPCCKLFFSLTSPFTI